MSDFDELEERLAREVPATPRPGLRDEVLARVHRELHPVRWGRFAVAAGLLIAALLAGRVREAGHRQRVAALLTARSGPRVERAIEELSPHLSRALKARFRLRARRGSDLRWVTYMTALHEGGRING